MPTTGILGRLADVACRTVYATIQYLDAGTGIWIEIGESDYPGRQHGGRLGVNDPGCHEEA
jgi:hypothetical protein